MLWYHVMKLCILCKQVHFYTNTTLNVTTTKAIAYDTQIHHPPSHQFTKCGASKITIPTKRTDSSARVHALWRIIPWTLFIPLTSFCSHLRRYFLVRCWRQHSSLDGQEDTQDKSANAPGQTDSSREAEEACTATAY